MVRAILREIEQPGTGKTQTRRALSPANLTFWTGGLDYPGRYTKMDGPTFEAATNNARDFRVLEDGRISWVTDPAPHQVGAAMAQWLGKLSWAVGDLLYVRESHHRTNDSAISHLVGYDFADGPVTREDRHQIEDVGDVQFFRHSLGGWGGRSSRNFPGIHMPRWASRVTFEVTDIRVERVQDISRDDAIAEGLRLASKEIEEFWRWPEPLHEQLWLSPTAAYRNLWDSINGDRPGVAWKYNPWVVAISFRPHLINIDAYLERSAP